MYIECEYECEYQISTHIEIQKYEINHDFSWYYCFLYLESNICNVSL